MNATALARSGAEESGQRELASSVELPPAIHADAGAVLSLRALSASEPAVCARAPDELAQLLLSGAAALAEASSASLTAAGRGVRHVCTEGTCGPSATCHEDFVAVYGSDMVSPACARP